VAIELNESTNILIGRGEATAHPSLALIKYWGKKDSGQNLPATPSLAVTLDTLVTRTSVELRSTADSGKVADEVRIDGVLQPENRFLSFFSAFREIVAEGAGLDAPYSITAESSSNFPAAAGLASSASGFAALSLACFQAAGVKKDSRNISSLARIGSASAARSVWGGFTRLDEGAESAEPLFDQYWWPEIRIVVVELEQGKKEFSSRQAMEKTRSSSPYYPAWISDAPLLMKQAHSALEKRNLDLLGPLIRMSYLRMFATMFAADPPIIYWKPSSLAVIRLCEEMRFRGIGVWETMDAGPQVKLIALEKDIPEILSMVGERESTARLRVCRPGGPAQTV
jgi:diphosphomevalonate decarboxylase